MKKPGPDTMRMAIYTSAVLLFLGMTVPMYAEQQQHEKDAKHQKQGQQAKPEKQRQKDQQVQQARGRQEQQRQPEQQARIRQDHHEQVVEPRVVWKEHRAQNWRAEHRTWRQRGGYNGYRIPKDRFYGNFGRNHRFRVNSLSFGIFGGYPRFQYSGFWFSVVDPWPEYWSDNWYDNDEVYIDYYGDGYYLYNRRHPRDRIAVTVFLN
jgi:hypothetical protein